MIRSSGFRADSIEFHIENLQSKYSFQIDQGFVEIGFST